MQAEGGKMIYIQRRINRGRGRLVESAEIVKENIYTLWVRLSNGDIIKRRMADIVDKPAEIQRTLSQVTGKLVKINWWQRLLKWIRGLICR